MEDYCVLDGGFATELMLSYNFEIDVSVLFALDITYS